MRVAIIGDYPVDETQLQGGVQAAFLYLVKGLAQIDGLQVHVLTLKGSSSSKPTQIERDGVTLHLLPLFPRFEFARNFRTYQAILDQELAGIKPHVVHAQDVTDHAYVALRSGYPTTMTVHGVRLEDGKYNSSLRLRLRNYLHSLLIGRYIMTHTRHLIAISHYVTNYYQSQLKPDTQVYYIPNAIAEVFFNLADMSTDPTILFAGRIIPRKRVLDLVQAFAKMATQAPAAQLRLAGECSSEPAYVGLIQDFIREANLEDRVHLLGSLPERAVLEEFAKCNVLALPSAQETAPMVIAQAMAAGKPVIATPVGGVAEMVQDGETGFLVKLGDIDGLANALLRVLADTSLQRCLGQLGHKFAVENYRADTVAKRTYEAYQEITAVADDSRLNLYGHN